MRRVILTALTALLLLEAPPMALRAHADEVRYKGRPKPPADNPDTYKKPPADRPQPPKPPVYKPPGEKPPAPRPPDREDPRKKPDPFQPPNGYQPPDPPAPPSHPHTPIGWPHDPPCPRPEPYPHPEPYPPYPQPAPCPPPGYPIIGPPGDERVYRPGIRDVLARNVHQMQIEGFTGEVVVGFGGRVEFDQAYNAGGYYDIGSATEAFTAWAIYRLVGDGKLELSTTLGELFPFAPADKSGITIEQLLENTSGLGNTFAADDEPDRDTAVRRLLEQQLAHAPGGEFIHSDDGYVILAAAIAAASGMRYERYLEASGVVSRDMQSTLFWSDLRTGHGDQNWGKRGSGGIFSTAPDLFMWASRFVDQPEYVTAEIMRPRVWTDAGVGIGYGWFSSANEDAPVRWTNGTGESDENVTVVVYPAGGILAVTSDRYNGDVPWSERVANTLEPLLRDWAPPQLGFRPLAMTSTDGVFRHDEAAR
ncbi:MAG TPA: serine hydrolase domain-containing protein [Candidatus Krumholzibacteria bacterium]|nr:serine hydrolase domain-containing protein [Candidatus Krumholzibacteria bacterium]